MTVQGAMRYDHAWSYFPEQTVGPVRFFPTAVTYPRTTGVEGYHDLWPRGGRRVRRVRHGQDVDQIQFRTVSGGGAERRVVHRAQSDRAPVDHDDAHVDRTTNRDFVADCNLQNPRGAGPETRWRSADGIDFCGANASANFGTQVFDSTLDPGLLSGWGVRSGDWQWGVSVQHEVFPRVAVEVGYQRRWLANSLATDNLARSAADHTVFGVTIPTDSRLPEGGGGVLNGLYNVTPEAAVRLNDNYQTLSSNIGDWTQVANSLNLNVTARMRNGLVLQGGFNTGTNDNDYCDVRSAIPEWTVVLAQSPTNPWCDTSSGWVTRVTALGSYTIPKVDVQVSGTLRSDSGGQLAANWTAPNSATVGLNRPFAGLGSQTITVNLIEPGTLYGERVNQIDMRFAKILRFGRTRTTVGFDVYNLVNSDAVLTYNQTFSPTTTTWLRPNSVLQPRFVKFSAQIDF